MNNWRLLGSTAAIALFSGSGAFADVTPEQVWQSWQNVSTSTGQTITVANEERSGDTLIVSGLKFTSDEAGATSVATVSQMKFTDNGDGTVTVVLSDDEVMQNTTPADPTVEGSLPSKSTISTSHPGMSLIASGTPEATNYAINAPNLVFNVVTTEGEGATATDTKITGKVTGLVGQYVLVPGTSGTKLESEFKTTSFVMDVDNKNSIDGTNGTFKISFDNFAGQTNGNFLDAAAMEDLSKAVKAGFVMDGDFSFSAMNVDFNGTNESGPTKLTGVGTEGSLNFAINAEAMSYGTSSKGVNFTLSSADIPFPELKFGYNEATFNLALPVGKSDTPADFAFVTKLVDLTVSDEVWGMFDPAGSLPRDPATMIIDTKGKMRMTTDMFDQAAMDALGEAAPGELHALDIAELKVSLAGALLTGAGAFTFDNTDTVTYPGMPLPTGKIDLKLTGGNGLMDKLVAMGLLTPEDVMGAKMMIAIVANAGPEGTDELTSTIEVKDKVLSANGQPLQ